MVNAGHLRSILAAAEGAGLRRYTHWHFNHFMEEEWGVIEESSGRGG